MVSDPSASEIAAVRYRLKSIGDTAALFPDAQLNQFWKERVAEVQEFTGRSYDTGNYLWVACIAWGTAYSFIKHISAGTMIARGRILGQFQIQEQGLNWNVGVFASMKLFFGDEFEKCKQLLDTGKYVIQTSSISINSLETALSNVMREVTFH